MNKQLLEFQSKMATQVEESLKLSNGTRQDYSDRMSDLYREHSNLKDEATRLIEKSRAELRNEISQVQDSFIDIQKKFREFQGNVKE